MAISSHIAVIDQGALQQYADPDVLYSRPKNLFVASFIGNPPMNFIDGTIERSGDIYYCKTVGGTLELPAKLIEESELSGNEVVLGIRPHNFELVDSEENAITMKTDYVEHLGKENLYRCYANGVNMRVITPVSVNRPTTEALHARPEYDAISVFDKGTSNNLTK